jgi:hypothetical protein
MADPKWKSSAPTMAKSAPDVPPPAWHGWAHSLLDWVLPSQPPDTEPEPEPPPPPPPVADGLAPGSAHALVANKIVLEATRAALSRHSEDVAPPPPPPPIPPPPPPVVPRLQVRNLDTGEVLSLQAASDELQAPLTQLPSMQQPTHLPALPPAPKEGVPRVLRDEPRRRSHFALFSPRLTPRQAASGTSGTGAGKQPSKGSKSTLPPPSSPLGHAVAQAVALSQQAVTADSAGYECIRAAVRTRDERS